MDNLFALTGRVLVIGGTRGIGRAVSLQFARAGASVVANFLRNQKAADDLQAVSERESLPIQLCRADVSTSQGIGHIERSALEGGARLSGMVYCAATGVHRVFPELTTLHFDWTFSLNVRAFFNLTKALLGSFSDRASIVAVSSMGAQRALPYYSLVGSSKGALEALARHLSVELAPRGIRVNILVPGTIATDVWKSLPDGDQRMETAVRRTPSGRLVAPEEVAYAAQFLCSEAAAGIIGQTLIVDGGAGVVG